MTASLGQTKSLKSFGGWALIASMALGQPSVLLAEDSLRVPNPVEAAGAEELENSIRRAAPELSKAEKEAEEEDKKQEAKQQQKVLSLIKVDYGYLPEEHPAVEYVRTRLAALLDGVKPEDRPRVRVLASTGMGINAMVFPDGTVVVTPELLTAIRYEEELDFVLLHEINHWYRKHHREMNTLSLRGTLVQQLGLARYQEGEADVAAFFQMMEHKRSGEGAIMFLERLIQAQKERKKRKKPMSDWEPVHGTAEDRIINLKSLLQLSNFHYLDREMTVVPDRLKENVRELPVGGNAEHLVSSPGKYQAARERWWKRSEELIGKADIPFLQAVLPSVFWDYEIGYSAIQSGRGEELGGFSDDPKLKKRELRKLKKDRGRLFSLLLARWQTLLAPQMQGLDPDERVLQTVFSLEGMLGIPVVSGLGESEKEEQEFWESLEMGRWRPDFKEALARSGEGKKVLDCCGRLNGEVSPERLGRLAASVVEQMSREDPGRVVTSLRFGARLLSESKAAAERHGMLDSENPIEKEIGKGWAAVLLTGVSALIKTGKWSKEKGRYGRETARLEAGHGFKVSFTGMGIFLEQMRYRGETVLANQIEEWAVSAWPQFADRQRHLKRLEKILSAIRSIKQEERALGDAELQKLLMEAAEHLNSLPEEIDTYSANHLFLGKPAPPFMRKTLLTRNELKNRFHLDLSSTSELVGGRHVKPPSNSSEFKFYLGWLASMFEDPKSYISALHDPDWMNDVILKSIKREASIALEDLESLVSFAKDPVQAAASLGGASSLRAEDLADWGLETNGPWQQLALIKLWNELKQEKNPGTLFSRLDAFAKRWPINLGRFDQDSEEPSEQIVRAGVAFLDPAPGETDQRVFEKLLLLTFFMKDAVIRRQLQEYTVLQLINAEAVSSEAAAELAFQRYHLQGAYSGSRVLRALMEKAKTYPEFDHLKKMGEGLLEQFRKSTAAGALVLSEGGIEHGLGAMDRSYLLRLLLESSRNDRSLRSYVGGYWKTTFGAGLKEKFSEEWLRSGTIWEDWPMKEPDMRGVIPFEVLMERIYRLGDVERYVLLRKLLTGEFGALGSPEERIRLLDAFLDRYLQANGDASAGILKEVLRTLFLRMPADELYLLLYPLLMERIANPPLQPGADPSETLGTDEWSKGIAVRLARVEEIPQKPKKRWGKQLRRLRKLVLRKFSWYLRGTSPEAPRRETSAEERAFSVVPESFYTNQVGAMSSVEMILETARQLGAPGVRFLQLLGAAVRLPESYRKKFFAVYDSIEGQSPLSVAETIRDRLPEYAKRIRRFVRRLGGGSLYTVYLVEVEATEQEYPGRGGETVLETVRVLNPNALYHARKAVEVIRQTLLDLIRQNPDAGYDRALPLVDMLWDWIENDVLDKSYESDDALFREQWNGWAPEGFQAKIVIPRSIPTGTHVVRRSEFVEGDTFTSLDQFPAPQRKELAALGARFYMTQVMSSVMGVLAGERDETAILSDISPGNYLRTTAGNTEEIGVGNLAALDRGMELKFDRSESKLLLELAQAATPRERVGKIVGYLWKHESNADAVKGLIASGKKPGQVTKKIVSGIDPQATLEKSAADIVVGLHDEGLKVPLKFDLLFKNFSILSQMAEDAGFGSLQEALKFKAGAEEAEKTLQRLAEKWGLADLPELRIMAVSPQMVPDHPDLKKLIGRPIAMGNVRFLFVPEQMDKMENLLGSFERENKTVLVQGFGTERDSVLDNFENTAQYLFGFTIGERVSPQHPSFRALLRQIVVNLSGLKDETIEEDDLIALEQALSVLA